MSPRDALYRSDPWGAHTLAQYRLLMAETKETIHRTMQLIEESRELIRRFELVSAAFSSRPNAAPEQ
jgi:hypothetical protein